MSHPKQTPLYERHVRHGGRMVEFAGYSMPVQYTGVVDEHHAVRNAAGIFDVSHMGELELRGLNALATLERLVPTNVSRLTDGDALYTMLLRPDGGIVDDVIVYRRASDDYLVVVNASNREKDAKWCGAHLLEGCTLRDVSDAWALVALQGPRAEEILGSLTRLDLAALASFQFADAEVAGARATVARTGYTGEAGFEIFVSAAAAPVVWDELLRVGEPLGLRPAGLGARDTLRTEMKYSLYGQDIDETTTPLEAGLGWVVKLDKGDFIGRDALVRQKQEGLRSKLVGFEMVDPGIARHGYSIFDGADEVGRVTSGTHAPSLGRAIGIGYVPTGLAAVGTEISISIRGKHRRARVVKTPFYRRSTASSPA